ncbi:hypothetical protein BPAE_0354g00030 [Botrytis paeoniae]|uniref:Uncharacterized protein n=1 Tax=Botrytis paeoniae TaxID=278948 RepID=A0A4Z1F6R4_9HELO|nr:hypothetical protein BPAE_0354g00030 [Botrytis paeoniae]
MARTTDGHFDSTWDIDVIPALVLTATVLMFVLNLLNLPEKLNVLFPWDRISFSFCSSTPFNGFGHGENFKIARCIDVGEENLTRGVHLLRKILRKA